MKSTKDIIRLKKKAAIISLIIGLGMFVAKIGAFLITGSAAIFSDAAESVVHVLATSIALYSIILSSKPPDKTHPYGHGNIEYFSAGLEGLLIVAAALLIIYEAVSSLMQGPELQELTTGIIIISFAGLINLFLGYYLINTGKRTNSLTLVADGKHVLTDSFTSIGVLVGIALVMITGITIFDPIFAIAVAINILFTGYKLVRESVGGLMNESDPDKMRRLVEVLSSIRKDFWIDLHELRFWQAGEKMFIDFHLILPYYFTIQTTHEEEKRIEAEIRKVFPDVQIKIHFDYCISNLCKFCRHPDCSVRSEKYTEDILWDEGKLTGDPVYRIIKKD